MGRNMSKGMLPMHLYWPSRRTNKIHQSNDIALGLRVGQQANEVLSRLLHYSQGCKGKPQRDSARTAPTHPSHKMQFHFVCPELQRGGESLFTDIVYQDQTMMNFEMRSYYLLIFT